MKWNEMKWKDGATVFNQMNIYSNTTMNYSQHWTHKSLWDEMIIIRTLCCIFSTWYVRWSRVIQNTDFRTHCTVFTVHTCTQWKAWSKSTKNKNFHLSRKSAANKETCYCNWATGRSIDRSVVGLVFDFIHFDFIPESFAICMHSIQPA